MNTSAGEKQRLILESEGLLAAAQNEGEALSQQVRILAKSLARPGQEPSEEERRRALDALVELRRIEQLKAIANGTGNSTYFFGDAKGTGRDAYEVENMERLKKSNESKFAVLATNTAQQV